MEILTHKDRAAFQWYLQSLKQEITNWLVVDVRASFGAAAVAKAAESVYALYKQKEGRIYVCNDREFLMLIKWGVDGGTIEIAENIKKALSNNNCEVVVRSMSVRDIASIERLINYKPTAALSSCDALRSTRREKVVMVADDDLFMRMLTKKGLSGQYTVQEVADGGDVLKSYWKYAPDVLLLDIHLPHVEGTALLQQILAGDPAAYIVMLSADSSMDNVRLTRATGAKGFLTKPFTRDKLVDYINKCPTI